MNSETFRKNIKQILIPEADLQAKIKEVGVNDILGNNHVIIADVLL